MDYPTAKARRDELEALVSQTTDVLCKTGIAVAEKLGVPLRGEMGLTNDAVKSSPEYRAAKLANDRAFEQLREYNGWYVKTFKAELRAEQRARRA